MDRDYVEIANLIARYAEALNMGRIEDIGEMFRFGRITSEGNPSTYEGRDEIVEMYRESVVFGDDLPDTLIFTTNLQIEIDGEQASGKAYFLAMHRAAGGVQPILAGRYHDEFQKRDGTWWFHRRHMFPDMHGDMSTHLTKPIEDYQDSQSAN